MPLRAPNNPTTDVVLLQAVANILVGYPTPNTQAGLSSYPVYLQRYYDLIAGSAYPALLLSIGTQDYQRSSRSTWMGTAVVLVDYYARYDQATLELDDILATIAADLERMKGNIESNESLAQNNTAYTISAFRHVLSPYQGTLKQEGGLNLVTRRYSVSFHLLPYDS